MTQESTNFYATNFELGSISPAVHSSVRSQPFANAALLQLIWVRDHMIQVLSSGSRLWLTISQQGSNV